MSQEFSNDGLLEVEKKCDRVPSVLMGPNRLKELSADLSKYEQDQLFFVTDGLFVTSVSTADGVIVQQPQDHLNATSVPYTRLMAVYSEAELDSALERLENIEVIESTRMDDGTPAVRFTPAAIQSGFATYAPVTKWLQRKLAERIDDPSVDRHLPTANLTETLLFDCLCGVQVDVKAIVPEVDFAGLSSVEMWKTLNALKSFTSGNVWIVRDRLTGRLCSPLHHVTDGLKQHLFYRDTSLCAVRVKDVELLLVGILAQQRHPKPDAGEFLELYCRGLLFDRIETAINVPEHQARPMLREFIHSKIDLRSDEVSQIEEVVSDCWPTIARTVRYLKLGDGPECELRVGMQQLLHSILFDAVQAVFSNMIGNHFCGMIGDGIACTPESVTDVENAIRAAVRKHDAMPLLMFEDWSVV